MMLSICATNPCVKYIIEAVKELNNSYSQIATIAVPIILHQAALAKRAKEEEEM